MAGAWPAEPNDGLPVEELGIGRADLLVSDGQLPGRKGQHRLRLVQRDEPVDVTRVSPLEEVLAQILRLHSRLGPASAVMFRIISPGCDI